MMSIPLTISRPPAVRRMERHDDEGRGASGPMAAVGPTDPDDARLVRRFEGRDPSAAGELYRRFAPRIFGLATAMLGSGAEAEEFVQDTFVDLWRKAGGFDPGRSSLDEWVLRIALGSVLRRRAPRPGTVSP